MPRVPLTLFDKKRLSEARKDAGVVANRISSEKWPAFKQDLKLGYIDPVATWADLDDVERRAVLQLALYAALRLELT